MFTLVDNYADEDDRIVAIHTDAESVEEAATKFIELSICKEEDFESGQLVIENTNIFIVNKESKQ